MEYANNYHRTMSKMARTTNRKALREFSWPINCAHVGGHFVLDVGCGDGSSTMEVLKPFLGSNVELEASDVSERMIRYANQNHGGEDVKFFVWDVQDEVQVTDMVTKYDHVYSFLCLHYAQDQRKALKNIHDILKPGGSVFYTTLVHLPFYEAFKKLARYPTWAPYLKEAEISRYSAPYQHESDPVRACTELMVECGFKDVKVERGPEGLRLDSWEKFVGLAKFGDHFCERLPEGLRDQYMKDYLEELKNVKGLVSEKTDDNGEPYLAIYDDDYKYLICYGVKPEL